MRISKNVMLSRMEITADENGKAVVFTIKFIKADGRIRTMRAMNHVKHPSINRQKGERSNFKYNLKSKNALLLYDVDLKENRTVLVDSIMYFNDMEVTH